MNKSRLRDAKRKAQRATSQQRWLVRGGALLLLLMGLVALLGSVQSRPLVASTELVAKDPIMVRFEGFIKALSPTKWIIGDQSLFVTKETAVIEKSGRAEVGAWVVVNAIKDDAGGMTASYILVERATGQSSPRIELTGRLEKITGDMWLVDGKLLKITFATTMPAKPALGDLIRVVAEEQESILWAVSVEIVSQSSAAPPVEFEGVIQQIGSDSWRVDQRTVYMNGSTRITGEPAVGKNAEVRANNVGGRLTATAIRITDPSAEVTLNALIASILNDASGVEVWDMIVFLDQLWGTPMPMTAYVSSNTLVDERRAVAKPGYWAEVRGLSAGTGKLNADLIRMEQPAPVRISGAIERTPNQPNSSGWYQIGGWKVWMADANATALRVDDTGQASVEGLLLGNGVIWVGPLPGPGAGTKN